MDSKDFLALQDVYKVMYAEAKDESPEKEEEDRKKDDDLAGSPNKNGDDKKDKKNGKKKAKRWWDDDGDGIGYEKGEVKEDMNKGYVVTAADKKGNTPAWQGYKKGVKKKDGSPLYRAADHLKNEEVESLVASGKFSNEELMSITNLQEADIADILARLEKKRISKGGDPEESPLPAMKKYHADKKKKKVKEEVELQEKKDKDTPDQVKAVIAYDKARKGTDDATYDSEHGDKKQAKKERDYAKWQRDQGAEFAQKSGHPWEHAKGSTREKEGKKSVKHAHVKDSYDWQTESDLWDDIAEKLSELHELGGVKFKVVPFDLQEEENWIQGAVKRPGAFTKKAKAAGMSVQQFAKHVDANKDKYSTRTERQANLAQTFSKMKKEGADFDALSSFLVQEGADDQAVNHIMANWVFEGYQRNPEEGERKEREENKKYEKVRGERTPMPPRGNKRREEFERWYAANVR